MSIFVSDTFTQAGTGETDLNSTHTGELGATWTDHPHANYPGPILINADLDRIYGTGTSLSYASAIPPSADYYVAADFFLASALAVNIAVCGRVDTTDDTLYRARLNGTTAWELHRLSSATSLLLGTSTNQIPSVGTAKRGKLVMEGNQISFYVEGVLEIGPVTNSDITAAGRAAARTAGASSSSTGLHFDNFEAGTLDVEANTIPYFGGGHSPYRVVRKVSSY